MSSQPSGTITFLFTDIEGSTALWEEAPEAMKEALRRHDAILREAIEARGGYVFKTMGDSFCAAFSLAQDAAAAAVSAQEGIGAEAWALPRPVAVRMAVHSGVAELRGGDYFGQSLNRASRILSAGYGGQILLSLAAVELCRDALPGGSELLELGERRLKDLVRPECIFQLCMKGHRRDFPPLKTLDARPNNLPLQASSFIGREAELSEIVSRIAPRAGDPRSRLLTLLGAGGAGKTRLSLQAAADLIDRFPDGAWFIDLAPLRTEASVFPAALRALDLKAAEGVEPLDRIREGSRFRKMLVVVDNCEHLVGAAATLAEAILSSSPGTSVLATSREALRIPGESVYPVPPLSLPAPGADIVAESLTQYESVRLFIERARAASPDFAVDGESAPAIADICCRLDGMPLAIELAAAKTRSLSAEDILSRLGDRFGLLTGGSRTALPRQQTLRALVDWSYDLLEPEEKEFLHRLSVFRGSFGLGAAETICGEGLDAVELLDRLCSKSLVSRDGHSRFRLLETLREYAAGKAGESGRALMPRFLSYYAELSRRDMGVRSGERLSRRLAVLAAEHENLRESLEWALRHDPSRGLSLAAGAASYWWLRGHNVEGEAWLEAFLAATPPDPPSLDRAECLSSLAYLYHQRGSHEDALRKASESLELFRSLGDRPGQVSALRTLGLDEWALVFFASDAEEELSLSSSARARFEEELAISREIGDRWGEAEAIAGLSMVKSDHERDFPAAEALARECLAIRTDIEDLSGMGWSYYNLAGFSSALGDPDTLLSNLALALECFGRAGDLWAKGFAYQYYASCLAYVGRYAEAEAMISECETFYRRSGDRLDYLATRLLSVQLLSLRRDPSDLEAAALILAETEAESKSCGRENSANEWLSSDARIRLLKGDIPGARSDIDSMTVGGGSWKSRSWTGIRAILIHAAYSARIGFMEGRPAGAARVLGSMKANFRRYFPFIFTLPHYEADALERDLSSVMKEEELAALMAEGREIDIDALKDFSASAFRSGA